MLKFTKLARLCLVALLGAHLSGCVVVPQKRRRFIADPTMQDDPLEQRARGKLHRSREGASGGRGQPAGGGCACTN